MKFFQSYSPTTAQKSIIRAIEILHMQWEDRESMPPPFITCLANTEQNLYFYPRDTVTVYESPDRDGFKAAKANITGPKNRPVGLRFGKDYLMIKVAFNPTGLYRLLKIPMQQTVNKGLSATQFFTEAVDEVCHTLSESTQYQEMQAVVSEFLDELITQGVLDQEPIDEVAIKMLNPGANYTLPEWASMACLSLRQFERNFMIRVGISPKMYLRIVRFENAMRLKNETPEKSWTEIALDCRYDDSSHLLREFRQFADFPPGTLFKKQTSGHGDFPTG